MITAPKTEWPKLISASKYAKRWYVDRTPKSIINDIKAGRLPGEKDGSSWCVWVNADLSPAREKLPGPKLLSTIIPSREIVAAKVQSILSRAGAG
jgi:hypothetical protein